MVIPIHRQQEQQPATDFIIIITTAVFVGVKRTEPDKASLFVLQTWRRRRMAMEVFCVCSRPKIGLAGLRSSTKDRYSSVRSSPVGRYIVDWHDNTRADQSTGTER
jgi:hypothetical protein